MIFEVMLYLSSNERETLKFQGCRQDSTPDLYAAGGMIHRFSYHKLLPSDVQMKFHQLKRT